MGNYRFDIWPVLREYGWQLPNPRGSWQTVKCGAHEDSQASCRISSDNGYVKCLACGFEGDAINIVQHYEGVDFRDAVRRCEEITGASDTRVSRTNRRSERLSASAGNQQGNRRYVQTRVRRGSRDR